MGGVLIMSIKDLEYSASLDLQRLYPSPLKFRRVEVGPVGATADQCSHRKSCHTGERV